MSSWESALLWLAAVYLVSIAIVVVGSAPGERDWRGGVSELSGNPNVTCEVER